MFPRIGRGMSKICNLNLVLFILVVVFFLVKLKFEYYYKLKLQAYMYSVYVEKGIGFNDKIMRNRKGPQCFYFFLQRDDKV